MRNYKMDNLKAFLIFCVIFGHILELFAGDGTLYRLIYTFHMPMFILLSGYYAKFSRGNILSRLVYPYLLFQLLYLLFDAAVLQNDLSAFRLQFSTPYWLLWYLLAMIFYYLLLPMMEGAEPRVMLAVVCVLSIAAGFDSSIGYQMTLSRFFTFLPYFVLGVILSQVDLERIVKSRAVRAVTLVIAVGACLFLWKHGPIEVRAFYGSYPYAEAGSPLIRALLLVVGINWAFFFLCFAPKGRIPVLSAMGKYTLIPFLMHGFIKLYMENQGGFFVYSRFGNLALAVALSLVILLVFGNPYVGKALQTIFTGRWIQRLWEKRHGGKEGETAGK